MKMQVADLRLISVLDSVKPSMADTEFGLAFIKPSNSTDVEKGALVAVDTRQWRITADNKDVILLDVGSDPNYVLVYLPPAVKNILTYNQGVQFNDMVDTLDDGTPVIRKRGRAALMLDALGMSSTVLFPESECQKSGKKTGSATKRKTPRKDTQQDKAGKGKASS